MLERVRLGGFSGTYSLRSAELARDRKNRTIGVTVLFLDDSTQTFQIDVSSFYFIYKKLYSGKSREEKHLSKVSTTPQNSWTNHININE